MRFRALPLAVLLAALVPAGAAHATPVTGPEGARCRMAAFLDPTAAPNTYAGHVEAGPLFVTDPATGVATGTARCTLTLGPTHNDLGAIAEAPGTGVVVVPPQFITYERSPGQPIYLCTRFTYSTGEVFYWSNGAWTTNPASVCDTVVSTEGPAVEGLLDSIVCPVLQVVPVVGTTLQNLWGCARAVLPPIGIDYFAPAV
jgi:hypothetical protein